MILQASSFNIAVPISGSSTGRFRRSHVVRAQGEPSEKSVEIMRKFSEQYARKSGTYFCIDKGVTAVVIKGLADHKDTLGAPLCPCRHYDDKPAEVAQGFWNCPCVPMRERLAGYFALRLFSLISLNRNPKIVSTLNEVQDDLASPKTEGTRDVVIRSFGQRFGHPKKECHCMLFLTPENDFAGKDQAISLEDIRATTANM